MRAFLNKYGIYVVVVALVIVGLILFLTRSTTHAPGSAFFIDEDSGQESVRAVTDIPPLPGAKGNPSIVKVYKYTTEGDKTVHVGYYIKFTPEMKQQMEELQRHPDPNSTLEPGNGMLVRKPDGSPKDWYKVSSPEGQKIVTVSSGPVEAAYP